MYNFQPGNLTGGGSDAVSGGGGCMYVCVCVMVFSVARGRPQRKRGVAGGHGCSNRGGRGGCVHGYGAVDRVTAA